MGCAFQKKCCRRCMKGTFIYLFVLAIILFVLIFGIVPVIFKFSIGIQRIIIFPTYLTETVDYSNIASFGIKGVRNFYVNVNDEIDNNVTLGLWQILPNEVLDNEMLPNDNYNYEEILRENRHNLLIYLHGNGQTRASTIEIYEIQRQYFQIIAVDYRGYGDSSNAEMTEDGMVDDIVRLFHWLRSKTEARIFFWGHSLGTGVSTHTIANLKRQNETASGLILETPFSSVTDVMTEHPLLQPFSWLPWFKNAFLDPMNENGFGFESKKYIGNVDCPIMIVHAKDDSIIPYKFAQKLYDIAIEKRIDETQGNVTFHLLDALGYDHMYLYLAPQLPQFTKLFIDSCLDFEEQHSKQSHNNNYG